MARQFSVPYQLPPATLLAPAADAAGRTGAYKSLVNVNKAYIVANVNQGNAATVALASMQAKDASGTGAKAINAVPIWLANDTSTSDALKVQTGAASFTTDATLKDKLVVFEIVPEAALDVNNGFAFVTLQTGASNAANVTYGEVLLLKSFQAA